MTNNFFVFNGNFYRQKLGSAIGSPISPILADIVLQDLINDCLSCCTFDILFWKTYVDDVLACVRLEGTDLVLQHFNDYDPNIQFTLEKPSNNTINFLDMSLTVTVNGSVITNWYRKPTHAGLYLNFLSHSPISQK